MKKYTPQEETWRNYIISEWSRGEQISITKYMLGKVDTVVDIGACIGASVNHYNRILKPSKIVAIEPDADNFKTLMELTQRPNNVVFINSGVYYGKSEVNVISYLDGNMGGYHVADVFDDNPDHGGTVIDNTFKVDELENLIDFVPDLIKIDVEGSEYNIIENSTLFKQAKFLFIEWHVKTIDERREFINKHLSDYVEVMRDSRTSGLFERKTNG